jgi:hypothetical protein
MNIVKFKSQPHLYYKEESGQKPNTVIKDDPDDERFNELNDVQPEFITIINAGNPDLSFTRRIRDISYFDGFWIISWNHEVDKNYRLVERVAIKRKYGRTFYPTKREAESKRRKGERIYYAPELGYYIVRLQQDIWREIFRCK